ncbi:pentapeptide repeat-containing protein [Vibrio sp. 10N.261.46.E11]|uniref:pentapeptide repeat-containing protein n=1 Tax=Vibrio sp. 10N.261.46.E11 TaxID=3229662 RepID=UPI003556B36D
MESTALTGVGAGFIATLTGVEATDGDVTGADITGADAAGVCVTGADVTGADVAGVDVTGVDVTGDVTAGVEGDGLDADEPPSPPPPPQPNNASGAMSNVIRMDFDNPQHCDCGVPFLCSVLDWLGNKALFEFS